MFDLVQKKLGRNEDTVEVTADMDSHTLTLKINGRPDDFAVLEIQMENDASWFPYLCVDTDRYGVVFPA